MNINFLKNIPQINHSALQDANSEKRQGKKNPAVMLSANI